MEIKVVAHEDADRPMIRMRDLGRPGENRALIALQLGRRLDRCHYLGDVAQAARPGAIEHVELRFQVRKRVGHHAPAFLYHPGDAVVVGPKLTLLGS